MSQVAWPGISHPPSPILLESQGLHLAISWMICTRMVLTLERRSVHY